MVLSGRLLLRLGRLLLTGCLWSSLTTRVPARSLLKSSKNRIVQTTHRVTRRICRELAEGTGDRPDHGPERNHTNTRLAETVWPPWISLVRRDFSIFRTCHRVSLPRRILGIALFFAIAIGRGRGRGCGGGWTLWSKETFYSHIDRS